LRIIARKLYIIGKCTDVRRKLYIIGKCTDVRRKFILKAKNKMTVFLGLRSGGGRIKMRLTGSCTFTCFWDENDVAPWLI